MIHVNQIGLPPDSYFVFEDLVGNSGFPQERQRVQTRPGVDDVAIVREGYKPGPIRMQSRHFVLDFASAANAIASYKLLTREQPQEVWRNSVRLGLYTVLGVEEAPPQAVSGTTGSIIPNAKVLHVCTWTLLYAGQPA